MELKTNQDLAFRKLQQVLLLRFSTWKQRYEMLEQKYIEFGSKQGLHPFSKYEVEIKSITTLADMYLAGWAYW